MSECRAERATRTKGDEMTRGALAILGAVGVLAVLGSSRKARALLPAPTSNWTLAPSPPSPPGPAPMPSEPKPRATPKTVTLQALHKYEIVADVLPIEGVSKTDFAEKAIAFFGLSSPKFRDAKDAQHDGWDVTRVTLQANNLSNRTVELDRFYKIAGAGTIWLVSARDVGVF